jgi:hypothetical protein
MGVDTDNDTDTLILRNSVLRNSKLRNSEVRKSEVRNSELRHAVDYSENSDSGIAEFWTVAVDYSGNSGSGIAELRTSGSALWEK